MRDIGITYVSLGIQSFSDDMLRHLGRPNTCSDNRRALDNTLGQFACVDVDLIFDIAYEQEDAFIADALTCFAAGVDQISTYPLMRFGYTPFGKARHYPAKEHRILNRLAELASEHGYERHSVWTFNRIGSPNYTSITREFYIGVGAGAASYTGSSFLINHFALERYIRAIQEGRLPIARLAMLSGFKSALYYLFWQAYTGAIDLTRFEERFAVAKHLRPLLRMLVLTGHLKTQGERAVLTRRGYDRYHDLERWVTYHFIEPLWSDMMKEHPQCEGQLDAPPDWKGRFWRWLAGVSPVDSD
jgi:oxygen-independent coproporphyrinogen-3 oxidase